VVAPRREHIPAGTDPDELGKRSVDLCGRNGLELDDWQAYVLTESLKRNGDHWAAKEVGLHVARQNGKTALALEVAKRGVTVNVLAPGFIETEMTKDLPREEVLAQIPARRFGKPEEVAAAAAFLCSESAAYITGAVISINGGVYT